MAQNQKWPVYDAHTSSDTKKEEFPVVTNNKIDTTASPSPKKKG